jgi:predicted nucleic acid-binding protein
VRVLPDASAWVAHLKRRDPVLVRHLAENRAVTCDVVVGELLLGHGLPPELLRHLAVLPRIPCPSTGETGAFIERHREVLKRAGLGFSQVEVLLAARGAKAALHTRDPGLTQAWRQLSAGAVPASPRR